MIPTNFQLIKMNEERGGARSDASARESSGSNQAGKRSALNSVNGKGEGPEFTDLSGPQARTEEKTTKADDQKVRELLDRFAVLNALRAVLIGAGGVVGLLVALS